MTALFDRPLELRVLATLADVSSLDVAEARSAADRSRLTSDDFHDPLHQQVWNAQMALLHDGEACDFYRVATRLKHDDRAKMPAVTAAAAEPGVSLMLASAIFGAADDLRALTLRRSILRFGREIVQAAENTTDASVLLTNAAATLAKITTTRAANWRTLAEVMEQIRKEMAEVASGKGATVIPTGIHDWDRLIGGLWPTLIVIGAHPGHGKSGLIARILLNLAIAGIKSATFSLEDQATWIAYRALATEAGITQFVLRQRKLSEDQSAAVHHGETAIGAYAQNIMIDERGALPPSEIVQGARDAILNKGARVVVVDHYGEVRHGEDKRDRHDLMIAAGLSDLRNLAKAYGVPIIVAAHLKPEAVYPFSQHDFRNASAFEQMSRVAVMWEKKEAVLKMQVVKNQFGLGSVAFELPFHGPSAMVSNYVPSAPAEQQAIPF